MARAAALFACEPAGGVAHSEPQPGATPPSPHSQPDSPALFGRVPRPLSRLVTFAGRHQTSTPDSPPPPPRHSVLFLRRSVGAAFFFARKKKKTPTAPRPPPRPLFPTADRMRRRSARPLHSAGPPPPRASPRAASTASSSLYLGLDLGTSGGRGAVVDGELVFCCWRVGRPAHAPAIQPDAVDVWCLLSPLNWSVLIGQGLLVLFESQAHVGNFFLTLPSSHSHWPPRRRRPRLLHLVRLGDRLAGCRPGPGGGAASRGGGACGRGLSRWYERQCVVNRQRHRQRAGPRPPVQ